MAEVQAGAHIDPTPGRLPPGQVAAALCRSGLPQFARRRPKAPDRPIITVTGAVARPRTRALLH